MRHIIFLFYLIIFIIFGCAKEKEDNNFSEPKPTTLISIDSLSDLSSDIPSDTYNDLTFVNDSIGYAVSITGKIIKTINGGNNWIELASPTTLPLKAIQFIDVKTGFIIGGDNKNGIFLKTIDGGLTWINQTVNTTESPNSLYFFNTTTGYVAGFNLLILTEDAGQSWRRVKNNTFHIYQDVKFKNPSEGIITIGSGAYLKTSDGGTTWDSLKSITNESFYQISYSTYKTFLRAINKLIIVNSVNQEQVVEIPYRLNKMLFLNEYQSIGIGNHYNSLGFYPSGEIYLTNDTWSHWTKKSYSPGEAIEFKAISKMSARKVMFLGRGLNKTKIVILYL